MQKIEGLFEEKFTSVAEKISQNTKEINGAQENIMEKMQYNRYVYYEKINKIIGLINTRKDETKKSLTKKNSKMPKRGEFMILLALSLTSFSSKKDRSFQTNQPRFRS